MSPLAMDLLWERTLKVFPILNQQLSYPEDLTEDEINGVIKDLQKLQIDESILEFIFQAVQSYLLETSVPNSITCFVLSDCTTDDYYAFHRAITALYDDYEVLEKLVTLARPLKKEPHDALGRLQRLLRSALLSQLPLNFNASVVAFYEYSYHIFEHAVPSSVVDLNVADDKMGLDLEESMCEACDHAQGNCECGKIMDMFKRVNFCLIRMGILDRLCGHAITELIEKQIEKTMTEMVQGMLRSSNLKMLANWMEDVIMFFLGKIYESNNESMFEGFRIQLQFFVCENYAKIIIDQFFNIIIEYPDSIPAIEDLKVCLKKLNLREHLMESVKRTLESRTLHPGVDTSDILTGYVAAIKSIRHLDPSGVLLETIIEPVKEYLRGRPDTVRCVITSLIEDSPSDLAEELARSEMPKDERANQYDERLAAHWQQWQPDPVDAVVVSPKEATKSVRTADIISMVVDIYGSKELFVNEYKNLLAERLLLHLDSSTDKEIRTLELLKLRFGENALHSCEVMLRDMSESKRINAFIHDDPNYLERKSFDIRSLILSCQFWPTFKKETLELPKRIMDQFEHYTKSYESFKGNRTLLWRPTNGKVCLEIEIDGKTMPFSVTPIQATIIMYFEEQKEWNVNLLAAKMKITPLLLKRKIMFWQQQGLVKEYAAGEYVIVEESSQMASAADQMQIQHQPEDDEEGDNIMESTNNQREKALLMFWSYIVGMLTNLHSMPLERIHQMLKLFASDSHGVEFTQQELKNFLQQRVQEQKLVYMSGAYQLPKN